MSVARGSYNFDTDLGQGLSFPLFSISWVYLYAGEKKGLKNGRDAFYDLFMGTPYSLFSGRKLGIEVNGAKQVNVPNFYLIIPEFNRKFNLNSLTLFQLGCAMIKVIPAYLVGIGLRRFFFQYFSHRKKTKEQWEKKHLFCQIEHTAQIWI